MKKIFAIVTILALLAGAAAAGWFVLYNKDAVAAGVAPLSQEPPVYVTFNTLQLPIMGKDRIEQLINISLAIEVIDQASADRVLAFAPKLNDAYIQALYGSFGIDETLRNGALDVTLVKRRLREVSARVMGDGVVKDVLIQMVIQRPI